MSAFSESVVEDAALAWLENLGWRVTHGLRAAPPPKFISGELWVKDAERCIANVQ